MIKGDEMDVLGGDHKLTWWLIGLLTTLFGWMGREIYKRLRVIEEEYAKKTDLATLNKQLKGDMARLSSESKDRHSDTAGRLDKIEEGVIGTHKRIDELFLKLLGSDGK